MNARAVDMCSGNVFHVCFQWDNSAPVVSSDCSIYHTGVLARNNTIDSPVDRSQASSQDDVPLTSTSPSFEADFLEPELPPAPAYAPEPDPAPA